MADRIYPTCWAEYTDQNGWHCRLYYCGRPLELWVHRVDHLKRGQRYRWYVTQEPEGHLDQAVCNLHGRQLFNDIFEAKKLAKYLANLWHC